MLQRMQLLIRTAPSLPLPPVLCCPPAQHVWLTPAMQLPLLALGAGGSDQQYGLTTPDAAPPQRHLHVALTPQALVAAQQGDRLPDAAPHHHQSPAGSLGASVPATGDTPEGGSSEGVAPADAALPLTPAVPTPAPLALPQAGLAEVTAKASPVGPSPYTINLVQKLQQAQAQAAAAAAAGAVPATAGQLQFCPSQARRNTPAPGMGPATGMVRLRPDHEREGDEEHHHRQQRIRHSQNVRQHQHQQDQEQGKQEQADSLLLAHESETTPDLTQRSSSCSGNQAGSAGHSQHSQPGQNQRAPLVLTADRGHLAPATFASLAPAGGRGAAQQPPVYQVSQSLLPAEAYTHMPRALEAWGERRDTVPRGEWQPLGVASMMPPAGGQEQLVTWPGGPVLRLVQGGNGQRAFLAPPALLQQLQQQQQMQQMQQQQMLLNALRNSQWQQQQQQQLQQLILQQQLRQQYGDAADPQLGVQYAPLPVTSSSTGGRAPGFEQSPVRTSLQRPAEVSHEHLKPEEQGEVHTGLQAHQRLLESQPAAKAQSRLLTQARVQAQQPTQIATFPPAAAAARPVAGKRGWEEAAAEGVGRQRSSSHTDMLAAQMLLDLAGGNLVTPGKSGSERRPASPLVSPESPSKRRARRASPSPSPEGRGQYGGLLLQRLAGAGASERYPPYIRPEREQYRPPLPAVYQPEDARMDEARGVEQQLERQRLEARGWNALHQQHQLPRHTAVADWGWGKEDAERAELASGAHEGEGLMMSAAGAAAERAAEEELGVGRSLASGAGALAAGGRSGRKRPAALAASHVWQGLTADQGGLLPSPLSGRVQLAAGAGRGTGDRELEEGAAPHRKAPSHAGSRPTPVRLAKNTLSRAAVRSVFGNNVQFPVRCSIKLEIDGIVQ